MSRLSSFSLALVLALVACKSTPSEKGAAIGRTVDEAAVEVERAGARLDAALASLDELVKQPAPDLGPQYKAFTRDLEAFESSAEHVSELGNEIEEHRQAYIAEWDWKLAEVNDEALRARSAERREAVAANFQKVQDEYGELRRGFDPLLSDMHDIRNVLAADLTMEGLRMVDQTVDEVHGRARSVRETLQELGEEFRQLGLRLRQGGPASPSEPEE